MLLARFDLVIQLFASSSFGLNTFCRALIKNLFPASYAALAFISAFAPKFGDASG